MKKSKRARRVKKFCSLTYYDGLGHEVWVKVYRNLGGEKANGIFNKIFSRQCGFIREILEATKTKYEEL